MADTDAEGPFERRARACQRALRAAEADAVVLFPSPNLYYVTGFHEEPSERHLFWLLPSEGDPVFVVPDIYREQVTETWVGDVRTWGDADDPLDPLREVVAERDLAGGRVLVDPTMWARFTQDLRAVLGDAEYGLADEVLADLRVRKDEAELAAMRRAAAAADEVVGHVRSLGADAVGMTEADLARFVERRLENAGGEELAFEVIVASGPNGARPHHGHGDREIRAGDPVVLDFGTRVDHYPSDQTRTVVFDGDPSGEFVAAHEAVRAAQRAGVEAVEPGATAGEVDAAARSVLEERGYGERFVHRTGHGVGLDVHEEPYIAAGSERELEPGMVFSVEPGVYVEGEFGVRVEDLVVVTDDGRERLNDAPRDWRV
ncbi:MAG: M24 family metallopeptidase [Halobacteriaceae archaeon]